jgi:putative ABC transport system ATP-binding protein
MKNQIRLNNISHYFDTSEGRIDLFDKLSCEFLEGKTYSIVGASGAGKSSLLSIIAGLDLPRQGSVNFTLQGKMASLVEMRRHSGFIFQQFHLMHELDAIGNVALPLRLRGDKNAYAAAEKWLDKVGLLERANHKPNQLSGGEQQRVAIARAFVTKPAFMFADEPTGNLDAVTSDTISDMMFSFAENENCTLIVVTHSEAVARRADICLRLDQSGMEKAA